MSKNSKIGFSIEQTDHKKETSLKTHKKGNTEAVASRNRKRHKSKCC